MDLARPSSIRSSLIGSLEQNLGVSLCVDFCRTPEASEDGTPGTVWMTARRPGLCLARSCGDDHELEGVRPHGSAQVVSGQLMKGRRFSTLPRGAFQWFMFPRPQEALRAAREAVELYKAMLEKCHGHRTAMALGLLLVLSEAMGDPQGESSALLSVRHLVGCGGWPKLWCWVTQSGRKAGPPL